MPWFIAAFVAVVALNSLVTVPVARSTTGWPSPPIPFARTVVFAMSQPDEVDINEILFRPTAREY